MHGQQNINSVNYESTTSHNSMARPQVADGGTASNIEDSCKYMEQAVADSRQGVVPQVVGWARC